MWNEQSCVFRLRKQKGNKFVCSAPSRDGAVHSTLRVNKNVFSISAEFNPQPVLACFIALVSTKNCPLTIFKSQANECMTSWLLDSVLVENCGVYVDFLRDFGRNRENQSPLHVIRVDTSLLEHNPSILHHGLREVWTQQSYNEEVGC